MISNKICLENFKTSLTDLVNTHEKSNFQKIIKYIKNPLNILPRILYVFKKYKSEIDWNERSEKMGNSSVYGNLIDEEEQKKITDIHRKILLKCLDGKISKEDEMQKLPFVMLKLITIGDDAVIDAYQKVYNAINDVFNNKPDDQVEIEDNSKEEIMELLGQFANQCRVDLGVSLEFVKTDVFEAATNVISQSREMMSGNNAPIEDQDNPVVEKENVVVEGIKYDIERHKRGHIRIYIDGKGDPLKGSKGILKKIDKANKLGLTEKDWLQTQRAGKAVISKLKEQKS